MVLKTDFTRSQENAQDDLNDNFQQLAPLIEADDDWIEVPLNTGASGFFRVRKRGQRVSYYWYFAYTGTLGTGAIICTIPEGYRQLANFSEKRGGSSVGSEVQLRWSSNGDVVLWAANPASTNVSGYWTFDIFD